MFDLCLANGGVGLAANQVGLRLNLAVAYSKHSGPKVYINPKILKKDDKKLMREGCLSIPGYVDNVYRFNYIEVQYNTSDGKLIKETLIGEDAQIFQHEVDHLNGKLFIDELQTWKSDKAKKKVNIWKRRNRYNATLRR